MLLTRISRHKRQCGLMLLTRISQHKI